MGTDIKIPEDASRDTLAFMQRLLGPVADASDFLGDKIRFYRWKSALRAIDRAADIARERNLEPGEVPLKFLVPFMEKASCEDLESELIEMWARLLARASTDYDSSLITFSDIISRLGPQEAEVLITIAGEVKRQSHSKTQSPMSQSQEYFLNELRANFNDLQIGPTPTEAQKIFREIIRKHGFSDGRTVLFCFLPNSPYSWNPEFVFERLPGIQVYHESKFYAKYAISIGILQREGLIALREPNFYSRFDPNNLNPFVIGYAELTNLGLEFFETCAAQQA